MTKVALPRKSKGERPAFFATEGLDELYGVVTSLAAELAAAYDRIDSLERLLTRSGVLDAGAIDSQSPDPDVRRQRAEWHQEYIDRVFSPLRHEQSDSGPGDGTTSAR
jgi:hypothetical protein